MATTTFSNLPDVLSQGFWTLCESPSVEFLQSDCAIAMINRSTIRLVRTTYGSGIARLGSEWFLPISPQRCLRVSTTNKHGGIIYPHEVDEINEFLVRAAHRNVYSKNYNPLAKDAADSHLGSLRFFEESIQYDTGRLIIDYLADAPYV